MWIGTVCVCVCGCGCVCLCGFFLEPRGACLEDKQSSTRTHTHTATGWLKSKLTLTFQVSEVWTVNSVTLTCPFGSIWNVKGWEPLLSLLWPAEKRTTAVSIVSHYETLCVCVWSLICHDLSDGQYSRSVRVDSTLVTVTDWTLSGR